MNFGWWLLDCEEKRLMIWLQEFKSLLKAFIEYGQVGFIILFKSFLLNGKKNLFTILEISTILFIYTKQCYNNVVTNVYLNSNINRPVLKYLHGR